MQPATFLPATFFSATFLPASILLPASVVAAAADLPSVCTRHGRAAAWRQSVRFSGRMLRRIPAAGRSVTALSWPVCDRCVRRRRRIRAGQRLSIGVCVASGAVVSAGAVPAAVATVALTGALTTSMVLGGLGSWTSIVRASLTPDGMALRVRRPAGGFLAHQPQP